MPPLNRVRRMPPEIRDEVHRLFAGGATTEAVADHLRGMGRNVSNSGVGRYRKYWAERIAPALEFREFVASQLPSLADQTENKLGLLNLELLQQRLNAALGKLDPESLDAEALVKLLVKAGMAQSMASRARREEITSAAKLEDYRAALEAKDGDLLTKRGDKLVRVEFVDAPGDAARIEALAQKMLDTVQARKRKGGRS